MSLVRLADVRQALRGEDHRGVLLAQFLEPQPDPLGEERVEQERPGFVEDQEGRAAVEPRLDAVEEVEQDRNDHLLAQIHEVRQLEHLEVRGSQCVVVRVEQRAQRAAQQVRLEGLPDLSVLDLDAEVGQRPVAALGKQHQGPVNLGGPVRTGSEGHFPKTYAGFYHRPAETRAMFLEKGWSKVAAFQTRNPMHRSHEHLAKIAIEVCDGVLIHQVLGALKPGDIPAEVRVKAIDALVQHYFVDGTILQAGYPIEMRYAGPREALLHAVLRQNFGCSHLVVGRDHAGVGDYYGPFDAHHIFDTLPEGSLKTEPLKIDITFFCYRCNGMATGKTCPHDAEDRLAISGTGLRKMFANHETIPPEFSRAEVIAVLQDYYDSLDSQ